MLLLFLTAGLLIGLGLKGAWTQQRALQSFTSVNVSINKNEVRSSRFGGFEPDVSFSYRAMGKTYQSSQAAPLLIHGSRDWAESIQRRIQSEDLTARVNPLDPADAYLLPIGRFRPYGFILFGLAILFSGLIPIRVGGVLSHEPTAITGGPYDWYDLTPGETPANHVLVWSGIALGWYLLGLLSVGHYYMSVPPVYEVKALVGGGLFAAAGLWPLSRALSAMGIASHLGTPKVRMTRKTISLTEPVFVRIEQPFMRDTIVREVRVALTCIQHSGLNSVRYFTASSVAVADRAVRGGEKIGGEFSFEVPEKKRHPSSRFSRWCYPRTDWRIEITVRTKKSSTMATFPVIAENTKRVAKAA